MASHAGSPDQDPSAEMQQDEGATGRNSSRGVDQKQKDKKLVGGLERVLFSHILGRIIPID